VVINIVCFRGGLGFWGLFLEPVQKRIHPSSPRKIVAGRSIRITVLLRTCMRLGRFKMMPVLDFAG
jgi:hypothetical protein